MKNLKIILTTIGLFSLVNCKKDACGYKALNKVITPSGCVTGNNTSMSGFTVATCYASSPTGDVAVIFDTRLNSSAPRASTGDWGATITAIHPPSWKANIIGQVFGIAIDNNEAVYLASSHVYAQGIVPTPTQNTSPATIYKCIGPTWTATPIITLPNSGIGTLNGIGNIAYDKVNDQLFTTNLEDGKIYRHNTGGTPLGVFDPWAADISPSGIVSQDEQVWGIGVNYETGKVKVYVPRVNISGTRSMYSITLNNDGSFPIGTNPEVIEINSIPGTQNTITDISFSSNKKEMLIAERGDPHESKVMSYSLVGSSWVFNKQYHVGRTVSGVSENAAGGVDFAYKEVGGDISAECDQFFWASGNIFQSRGLNSSTTGCPCIYGLGGIPYTGNNPGTAAIGTANKDTDILIDFNPTSYTIGEKNTIGDVEVFDADKCRCVDF